MREIKFKLLYELKSTGFVKIAGYEKWYEGCWSDEGGWKANPCWLYSTDNETWSPTPLAHNKKLQFIGIKAKGKEIYEGDLLCWDGDIDALYEVFYNDDTGSYSCCRTHYREGSGRCGGYIPDIKYKALGLVGNIYENPELLGEKK